ncbi:MAG: pyruvate:ferredoxin (flavodoxin) oxidoreductase, partial [Clostridiales bacterium]|nr:pyruvate:ferredoxin (flavodoxin) oxidoreductase [Clostridiales bacterium]
MLQKKTMDGNAAAAHSSYAFTEVSAIYPITPSSPMAEITDEWSAHNKKNIFNKKVKIIEMQSEAGAAGTVHGSLSAGALTTTYTASQGLLLMIPNMYKIAGELLPAVIHVTARTIATHALSIFGDHGDVMSCRQTGFAMLCSSNVQEVMDLTAVSHLSAIKSRVPFMHFFDGFRTSHEIQKIDVLDYEDLKKIVDWEAIKKFKLRSLNPENPFTRGTAQNSDVFFQVREASNIYYQNVPNIVENYMNEINKITGRDYKLFNYYGDINAENIIIAMGSGCDAIEETIDYLNLHGEKVGMIKVHLYRPFSIDHLFKVLPNSVKKIAVLDRTKEPGSLGEPLYQDIVTAFFEKEKKPIITAGRYGIASKEFTPAQIIAIFNNLKNTNPKKHFTVGIIDDITNFSLDVPNEINVTPEGTISCKFWGIGSDGTVGANKNSIKIIGDHTDLFVQAYFSYDSKKSGGVTQSHLRFGDKSIRATYLVNAADFIACHKQSYIYQYDMTSDLKDGGVFLLNCSWNLSELEENLPVNLKRHIANHNIKFYIIDATKIAKEIGLGGRINTILQAAFFKLTNIIPVEKAKEYMKDAILKTYGKKGEKIVNMNYAAVDAGLENYHEVKAPDLWKNIRDNNNNFYDFDNDNNNNDDDDDLKKFVKKIANKINKLEGHKLKVSDFVDYVDGTLPHGTSQYEKRGIAIDIPEWIKENCIQCNQCSLVCPHAAVRSYLISRDEVTPESFEFIKANGKEFENYNFRIQVSPLDCTGCCNCVQVCPAKNKALVMKSLETQENQIKNWNYATKKLSHKNIENINNIKNSQFVKPLLEFSGACAGCGETPYAKLLTQLFGDRMYIANATGCSSIWGGSYPSSVYTKNHENKGPAWSNSLFEDNAEFGLGMYLATKQIRENLRDSLIKLKNTTNDDNLKSLINNWSESFNDGEKSKVTSKELLLKLEKNINLDNINEILELKKYFIKKSQWILGGDGWAYDIGFGGLDHVLASGENINVLVFDTEVYSNTGGQSSKATPTGAVAKFASSGKKIKKKDLGMIAMSYGYVYVAQVAMGASQSQLIKAFIEAERYDGPSLIIAYAPCVNHGIKSGMSFSQEETKRAVASGYWHLYRYNPELELSNKNPFILDSKEPTLSYQDFINQEVRYSSLKLLFPEKVDELFKQAELDAKKRYESYKKLANF